MKPADFRGLGPAKTQPADDTLRIIVSPSPGGRGGEGDQGPPASAEAGYGEGGQRQSRWAGRGVG
jgi:hypothetical protein